MDVAVDAVGARLRGHLARAETRATGRRHGLVLCHGFPSGPRGAANSAETYPDLADRLATEAEWVVLSFNFRGTGDSEGDFSLGGWLNDLRAAIDFLLAQDDVDGVWLCGFSTGGALAICAAAEDERVQGVATMAAPADFDEWADDPERFLAYAREVGVIRSADFPSDKSKWAAELRDTRASSAAGKIPPRPLLVVHGSEDDVVSVLEARQLADAADGSVELRVLTGAGHRLRHDPRAIAVLLGWLDRQVLN